MGVQTVVGERKHLERGFCVRMNLGRLTSNALLGLESNLLLHSFHINLEAMSFIVVRTKGLDKPWITWYNWPSATSRHIAQKCDTLSTEGNVL